ncbi:unnamed protein product [Soboliphyme baturini]|uniref:protein-disulfide reductase n=1 Tax=Soboliphyme baturini TaxID=241478 RepID=A0A183IKA4_9BILA|nr:unnamed protein product [Soboliphyme baturini]
MWSCLQQEEQSKSFPMNHEVVRRLSRGGANQTEVLTKEFLADKTIALYFQASWCHVCQNFTKILKKNCSKVKKDRRLLVLVVNQDEDEPSYDACYKAAPKQWLWLPFNDKMRR